MATITANRTFDAPPDVVWDVVTDPNLYASVAPNLSDIEILEGSGEGMVRRCVDTNGNAWTESVTCWEAGRRFGVTVDVANSEFHRRFFDWFEGEWELAERGGDVLVTIRFDYEPRYGPFGALVSAYFRYRAPSLLDRIFDGWEAAIASRLDDPDSRQTDHSPEADHASQADPETTDATTRTNALYR